MVNINFYDDASSFRQALDPDAFYIQSVEDDMRTRSVVHGYCHVCDKVQDMTINGGPDFGDGYPNLREGLVCVCGAKNRDRLMVLASAGKLRSADRSIFFGAMSGWATWARQTCGRRVDFCEYLPDSEPGSTVKVGELSVRNEDMTRMTFADGSSDLVLHQDVLEHIPDHKAALSETLRVLRPGGATIFTAPFFHVMDQTFVRAALKSDGSIEHYAPEERHGDPLSPEGILAFYNFGWSLLADMRAAGFVDVRLGILYRPDLGLVSNGCPVSHGNMLPVFFSGTKRFD